MIRYHGQRHMQFTNKQGLPGPKAAAVGGPILFSPRFGLNLEFLTSPLLPWGVASGLKDVGGNQDSTCLGLSVSGL